MKRLENENFESYKLRRKKAKLELKQKLKGKWFWKSKVVFNNEEDLLYFEKFGSLHFKSQGTYKRV